MTALQNIYTFTASLFLLVFFTTWWFKLLLMMIFTAAALIYHFVKLKKLKHEKADIERQLHERNELLQYSKLGEQKANEKILRSEQSKTALLSRINHEVRTPMNGVLGMTSLLDQTELTPEQKEYTAIILSSGKSLLGVVNEIMMNDILEYSKLDSGKELDAKNFDLSNCIEEIMDVFAVRTAKVNTDLLYSIDNSVPSQIMGDVRRVRQILMNLIDNAVKVTSNGEIYVGVQLLECKDDNRIKLEFEVRDTGSGITDEKMKLVKGNLSVANNAINNGSNTGVGLIICKKLVELMGGTIRFSTDDKGTAFTFTIYTKAGMQAARTHNNSEAAGFEDKKILIVDDNPTACEILRKQLENAKMITSSAASGDEALEMLSQVSFDLVIADQDIPGMDGIQLAEAVRKKYPAIPVILLNPVNDERYKQHTDILGGAVQKPVKQRILRDTILTQFRHKGEPVKSGKSVVRKLSENFSAQYPLNILIAEDNPINQKWTTKTLSKLGYNPEVVVNGKEVLEIVSNKQYDLILMDVQMPEMDGMEATRMIRLCLETQPVIIAMTANAMQGDRQDCIQSGMDDYISKPVELNELVGMLEKWGTLIREKKQSPQLKRAS